MNLDSLKSLENELTKNIPAFYKELLKTWIGMPFSKYSVQISSFVCFLIWL
jgi:hypothetical protein